MRVLILGAGAMGGYYGGRLIEAKACADVTFLVREGRKKVLAERGLVIESASCGDLTVPVRAITAADLPAEKAFDVVLFTCKAYDLDDAIETIAPAVTDATVVLPVLNGMSHMERLNARFGEPRVWGGVAKIAAQAAREAVGPLPPEAERPHATVVVHHDTARVRVHLELDYPSDLGARCGRVRHQVVQRVSGYVGMAVPEVAVQVERLHPPAEYGAARRRTR